MEKCEHYCAFNSLKLQLLAICVQASFAWFNMASMLTYDPTRHLHFYIYRHHLGYKHSSIKEATSWVLHGKTNTWIIKLYLHKFPQFISQLTNQRLRLKRHWTGDRTDYLRLSTHRLNQLPQVQIDKTFLFLLSPKHSAFGCYLVTPVICFQGEKVDSLLNQACLNRWKVQCHKHEGI